MSIVVGRTRDFRLFFCSVFDWVVVLGVYLIAVEATNHWILFIGLPLATFFSLKHFAAPPPNDDAADAIFGRFSDTTVETEQVTVWAHRFAGIDAPENTLDALSLCTANGAKGVEFDVVMTADFVPVVVHDTRLNRVCNIQADVRELTWSKVQTLVVGANFPFREEYPEARIPLLEDVINECIKKKVKAIIDLKDDRPEIVETITELYKKHPELYTLAAISGFDPIVIYQIRQADPRIVGCLAWRPLYYTHTTYSPIPSQCKPLEHSTPFFYWRHVLNFCHRHLYNQLAADFLGLSALLIQKDNVSSHDVVTWHRRGLRVIAWTVNSAPEKRYFIDGLKVPVITDTMKCNF